MVRKIFRDIIARKTPSPLDKRGEGSASPASSAPAPSTRQQRCHWAKKSPHILDLSQPYLVNSNQQSQHGDNKPHTTIIATRPRSKKISILIQLTTLACAAIAILFIISSAKSISAGKKLFNDLAQTTKNGYGQLVAGSKEVKNQNTASADNLFEEAYAQFQQAQSQIWFINTDPTLSKYTSVLESGRLLATSGKEMIDIMQEMKQIPALFAQDMSHVSDTRDAGDTGNTSTAAPTALSELKKINAKIIDIHANVKIAADNFNAIAGSIPAAYKPSFEKGLAMMQQSETLLEEITTMLPGIIELLGNGKPHRTLIALQNNDEVRPTGGFIGSFINLVMENGHVTSLKLEDVYDMDGQFSASPQGKTPIAPPPELAKLTDRWFFRDANYSADFRISGEKLLWFYGKERGETVDSIIAVNQNLLGKILAIIGPIEITNLEKPLTADNYREVLTYMIETKRTGAEDPKKILKDLMPIVQTRLFQSGNMAQFQQAMLEEVVQKNILGYSKNSLAQTFFETLGSDGAIQSDTEMHGDSSAQNEDYLSVIASSTSGNKSDAYMTQNLEHSTVIDHDGAIYDQLTIKRTHTWSGATEEKWRTLLRPFHFTDFPEHFLALFGKGDNVVNMRIYIPTGSQLITTEGVTTQPSKSPQPEPAIQFDPAIRRAYIPFAMTTHASSTNTIKIRYKLPFELSSMLANTYTLNVQKQPGARTSQLTKRISYADFMALAQSYPAAGYLVDSPAALSITKPLLKDQRFSLLFTRESMLKNAAMNNAATKK